MKWKNPDLRNETVQVRNVLCFIRLTAIFPCDNSYKLGSMIKIKENIISCQ